MKSNDIIQSGSAMYRIIDIADTKAFVVDCKKKSMPKWLDMSSLQGYTFCSLDTGELQDINEMGMQSRKTAYERFSVVSNILPFMLNTYPLSHDLCFFHWHQAWLYDLL